MTAAELKIEYDKLVARAKRVGLLRASYPDHGVAVLEIPPIPAASPDAAAGEPAPAPPQSEAAP